MAPVSSSPPSREANAPKGAVLTVATTRIVPTKRRVAVAVTLELFLFLLLKYFISIANTDTMDKRFSCSMLSLSPPEVLDGIYLRNH
jgi:hypothetical protein